MTFNLAIATVIGSAIFPLVIHMGWGKMVEEWGAFGGWMAATFIVGTIWLLNHGISTPMITQTGAWVDQGVAAGIGLWFAGILSGDKVKASLPVVASAIIGGIISGWVLSLFL